MRYLLALSLLEMLLITGKGDKCGTCPYNHFSHAQSAVCKVFIEYMAPLKDSHGKLGEALWHLLMLLHVFRT